MKVSSIPKGIRLDNVWVSEYQDDNGEPCNVFSNIKRDSPIQLGSVSMTWQNLKFIIAYARAIGFTR